MYMNTYMYMSMRVYVMRLETNLRILTTILTLHEHDDHDGLVCVDGAGHTTCLDIYLCKLSLT